MIRVIAPRGKIIVSIDKGDNRLSFDITKIRSGKLVTCGADVSFAEEAGDKATVFFGELVAEVPSEQDEKTAFIVMDETNVRAIYPGV